jgi:mono/diheme cytochrome c family protein
MSVRNVLVVINLVALVALGVFAVLSVRRNREKTTPQNLAVFHDDETLEGPHLERVLGWTLFFAAIIAVALPVYWLREPNRQNESVHYFDEGAVNRGAVLFANNQMAAYDQAKSLQCANCHGTDLGGGSTSVAHTFKDGTGAFVDWRAPALNTVLKRFSPQEVHDIITFGRPGTPMQAWGVEGGGPKNDQSLNDLVAFITSKQLSVTKARKQSDDALTAWAGQPAQQLKDAQKALTDAQKALRTVQTDSKATVDDRVAAQKAVEEARTALAWAQDWVARRANVSQGQLLFEVNCARCHTLGWSVFNPETQKPENVVGQPGAGAFGPDLGDEKQRFTDGTEGTGVASQEAFISLGSDLNKPYGNNGVGNGKMPGFAGMLTKEQIAAIVQYEREGLGQTTDKLEGATYPGAVF